MITAKYLENNNGQRLGSVTSPYADLNPPGGRVLYSAGSIFYSDSMNAAHVLYGPIERKYLALGAQAWKGYPTNDAQDTWYYDGQWNSFDGIASIYYKWDAGEAYAVQGWIQDVWSWLHYEAGPLGFPVTDEYKTATGCASRFENGGIYLRSEYALGGRSEAASTWPVMYQNTIEHPGTHPDPNAPTLSVGLVDNESGWTVVASGSHWTQGAHVVLSLNYTGNYTEIATGAGGEGIEVQPDGTFYYNQANSSGEHVAFADCVAVNNIVTIQAREVETESRMAVVGLAKPPNCTRSEDP